MHRYRLQFRDAAWLAARAVDRTLEDLRSKRLEQEPAFTDRLLARLEDQFDGTKIDGIAWRAKTFTDRGPGAQEKRFGADFCGVLNIKLANYHLTKGFLAQAKMIEANDRPLSKAEYERLQHQCRQMLRVTADSFLFLYGRNAVAIVPAISVISARRCNPHQLFTKSATGFFQNHFECFIGDPRLRAATISELERLLKECELRRGYILEAKLPVKSF